MSVDPALERAVRERLGASEFVKWMGLELTGLGDGTSEITLKLEPHHLNPGNIAHGGIVATLLDAAIGLALRTRLGTGRAHVTAQLGIQYIAPGPAGASLVARGRVVKSGRRAGFGEADLFDDGERLIAKGTATFLVVDDPRAGD